MENQVPTLSWLFFSFEGRIARRSFFFGIVFLVLPQVIAVMQIVRNEGNEDRMALWGIILILIWGASLWSAFALAAKRLHDLGATGWLSLIAFFPAISWLFFLALTFLPSSSKTNQWGPPPFAD